jgi:hypothetical protein
MTTTCTPTDRTTRSLLGYGIVAGPAYVLVGLAQAVTREGFDLGKHSWSLLANGELGWIQIANFIAAGLMTVAAAIGVRRSLPTGTARRWAPPLLITYGVSLVGAGLFRADPAQGFPVGAPGIPALSWHGILHLVIGGVGFSCLIAACLALATHFAREGRRALAWFSRITGVVFLTGFAGIASGSHGPTTAAFLVAVVTVWAWLTTVSLHYFRTATAD